MLGHAGLLIGAAFLGVLAVYGLSRVLETRTGSFRSRHRIWTHAVAAQLLLAVLLFAVGPVGWPAQFFTRPAAQSRPIESFPSPRSPYVALPPVNFGRPDVLRQFELPAPGDSSWGQVLTVDDLPRVQAPGESEVLSQTIRIPGPASSVAFLIGVWFAGTSFLLVRLALQQLRWWYGMRRSAVAAPPSVVVCVERVAACAALRWRPRVVVGPLVVPAVAGIFRPVVMWPESAAELVDQDPEAAQAVLAHELAHLSHSDPLWKLLAHLLVALLWWHPAVWWTRKRLSEVSEFAADEAAIAWGQDRVSLANGLVRFASDALALGSLAASGGPVQGVLRRRVQHLLKADVAPEGTKGKQQLLVWTTAFVTWLGGSGVAQVFPSGGGGSVMAIGFRFWHKAAVAAVVVGASLGWQGLADRGAAQEERERHEQRVERESPRRGDERERDIHRVTDRPRHRGEGDEDRVSPEQVERVRREIERLEHALLKAREAGREEAVARIERELAAARRELTALIRARALAELREHLEHLQAELREAEEGGREELAERLRAQIEEVQERIEQVAAAATSRSGHVSPEGQAGLPAGIDELLSRLELAQAERQEIEADIAKVEQQFRELKERFHNHELHRARRELLRQWASLEKRRDEARRAGREQEARAIEDKITALKREFVAIEDQIRDLEEQLTQLRIRLDRRREELGWRSFQIRQLERTLTALEQELRAHQLRGARQVVLESLAHLRKRREEASSKGRQDQVRAIERRIASLQRELLKYESMARKLGVEQGAKGRQFAQRLERAVNILRLAGLEDMAEILLDAGRERLERLQHPEHREREERQAHEREEREEREHEEHGERERP